MSIIIYRFDFTCFFLDTDTSQSSVATHLRCVVIFSYSVVKHVFLIHTLKYGWKSVNIIKASK